MKLKIQYKQASATYENLMECLNRKCIGMHFSGLSISNRKESFFNNTETFNNNKRKGDFILFENLDGTSFNLYQTELKKIISQRVDLLSFVVVSSI